MAIRFIDKQYILHYIVIDTVHFAGYLVNFSLVFYYQVT